MKTIVMLTCPRSENVCTGAGCFRAFNERTHRFARYGKEPLQVTAYMKCSGCGHFIEKDKGLAEKVEAVLAQRPDAIHLGICCCHDGRDQRLCDEVAALEKIFEAHGIPVIHGTHSVF